MSCVSGCQVSRPSCSARGSPLGLREHPAVNTECCFQYRPVGALELLERQSLPCKMITAAPGAERRVVSDLCTAQCQQHHCLERQWIPGVS